MGITWGESSVCQRPAMRGLTSPNTLPAAFGEVWAALSAIVARSIERPDAAASAAAGGKHSWMSRSTPPSQARTSGQPGAGVARVDERQTGEVEAVADGAAQRVDDGKRRHLDAVLLVDDLGLAEVELGHRRSSCCPG